MAQSSVSSIAVSRIRNTSENSKTDILDSEDRWSEEQTLDIPPQEVSPPFTVLNCDQIIMCVFQVAVTQTAYRLNMWVSDTDATLC